MGGILEFREWLCRHWLVAVLVVGLLVWVLLGAVFEGGPLTSPAGSSPTWQEIQNQEAAREAREALMAAAALLQTKPAEDDTYGYPIQFRELPAQGYGGWEYIAWVDPSAPGCKSDLGSDVSGLGSVYAVRLMAGYYYVGLPEVLPCWFEMAVRKVPGFGWAITRDAWNMQMVSINPLYGEELRLWRENGGRTK